MRLPGFRQIDRAFGRGNLLFLNPRNRRVLTFIRQYEDETILVVANLARSSQFVELDLSEYKGMVPVEMFGGTEFPRIGELPYLLTLGPNGFFWLSLGPQSTPTPSRGGPREVDRRLHAAEGRAVGRGSRDAGLEGEPVWLPQQPLVGRKARR
jgi:maltose alpha-D-glucosyltransferase/alpha-amylase